MLMPKTSGAKADVIEAPRRTFAQLPAADDPHEPSILVSASKLPVFETPPA